MAIDPLLIKGLDDLGITTPTTIQEKSIPYILDSKTNHLMGQSKTGTGKTLAFAIPIVQTINSKKKEIQSVVLVPTRELCKQVSKVFQDLTKYKKLKIVEVYGGVSINNQIHEIKHGGQIIIATPGRLIDLFKRGAVSFRHVRIVTLDEADRMLDMGFFPDVEYLLLNAMKDAFPKLMLFSATLESRIKKLAKKFTKGKELAEIYVSKDDDRTVKNCAQSFYLIRKYEEKYANFVEIINNEQPYDMLIFVRTKRWAEKLAKRLKREKKIDKKLFFKVDTLHGNLTQAKRETVVRKFKAQQVNCIVATNLAARGLDLDVSYIINYDFPDGGDAVDDYIHRIGRTARMDSSHNGETRKGKAISLVLRNQVKTLKEIERHIKLTIERKPLPKIVGNLSEYGEPIIINQHSDRRKNRSGKGSNRGSNRNSKRRSKKGSFGNSNRRSNKDSNGDSNKRSNTSSFGNSNRRSNKDSNGDSNKRSNISSYGNSNRRSNKGTNGDSNKRSNISSYGNSNRRSNKGTNGNSNRRSYKPTKNRSSSIPNSRNEKGGINKTNNDGAYSSWKQKNIQFK